MLAVLVPAHNEEDLLGRCVRSLSDQSYPRDLYRVIVIADNCLDSTAERAAIAGAEVMIRTAPDARGKGQALAWAIDQVLGAPQPPDAIVVVDADSVASTRLLEALEAELAAGAEAVQSDYLVLDPDASSRSQLVAAGFRLFHRTRPAGRAVLGMAANLVGNGMLFSRGLLERHHWTAFTAVEDLEYTISLRLAGIKPRYTAAGCVFGPLPSRKPAVTSQRLRWEGGRWHVVRTKLLPLLAASIVRRDPSLLDAALDLAVPPLGLLVLVSAAGALASAVAILLHLADGWAILPWLVAMASIVAFVGVGLRSAGAPLSTYRTLLQAPCFLLWKLSTYLRMLKGFDVHRWERSERASAGEAKAEVRPADVAGVRIDPVNMEVAIGRLRTALESNQVFQVATVNLDFLVRAQTDPRTRDVFRHSDLNLADGAPVVWLGRLLGHSIPARVAGADLVPRLAREAAQLDASIFFLGGENGVAAAAAARLRDAIPAVQIAGWYEPPRASIEDMDNEAILAEIAASGAKILLVALGHPKQDLWIDRYRNQLTVSVAIGVGCVFDLLAGRSRRAPLWMQRWGLEWLYRLAQEPHRLFGRYATDASWLALLSTRVLLERVTRRERFASG